MNERSVNYSFLMQAHPFVNRNIAGDEAGLKE
jgi:hypothetical protein